MEERLAACMSTKNPKTSSGKQQGSPAETVRLILASGSPRRLDLLSSLGLSFHVVPSRVDEDCQPASDPSSFVLELAQAKARDVADLLFSGQALATAVVEQGVTAFGIRSDEPVPEAGVDTLVLGADTIVVLDGDILGKPKSHDEACRMLSRLAGRCHHVYTGIAIIELPDNKVETGYEATRVYFRQMDAAEIEAYVATGEPMDKAGAYALQGTGSAFVERIEGCFTNVIGLPVPLVVQMLRRLDLPVLGMPK